MINKILLSILIFAVIYILLIFKVPTLASIIEDTLWIKWFNEFIIWSKWTYDDTITKLPSAEELTGSYSEAYSWAINIKENILEWADYTRDKIDWFREAMSWAEETYKDIKDWIDTAKDFIDNASWALNDTKELIDNVSVIKETLTNTWTTN